MFQGISCGVVRRVDSQIRLGEKVFCPDFRTKRPFRVDNLGKTLSYNTASQVTIRCATVVRQELSHGESSSRGGL